MTDLDVFPTAVDLTEDEKNRLSDIMASSYRVLSRAAFERYGKATKVPDLRDEFKEYLRVLRSGRTANDPLWCDPMARDAMHRMILIEPRVIAGYVKMSHDLCESMDLSNKRPGVTYSDYRQEACIAIYNAQYRYTGKALFSTFAFWCIRRRLIDFIRMDAAATSLQQDVKRMRALAREHGYTPADAASKCQSIKPDFVELLRRKSHALATGYLDRSHQQLYEAVKAADLTEIERKLVEAYLAGEYAECKTSLINPNTGLPYSRTHFMNVFREACRKIRLVYTGEKDTSAA